tara:strand:+ start:33 stop:1487 length:1455 start_codon:yes stop_codon:yes gene_type:complete
MALAKSQRSLRNWTKQEWRTKSGKPSAETGERYLPKKAIESLSSEEYARTTKAKREGTRKGRQFVKQPKKIAKKTRQFRNVGGPANATQAPPEFLQEIGEYSKAKPISPYEAIQLDKEQLSTDPVIANVQKAGKAVKSFFVPENPIDFVLAGIAPLKAASTIKLLDNTGTVVSDKVAQRIFNVQKELKDIKNLEKRNLKIEEDFFNDKISDEMFDLQLDKNNVIKEKIKDRILNLVEKKLDKIILNRTIPELNPRVIGRVGTSDLLKVSETVKNKNIIKNIGANLDSPGLNFIGIPYGVNKLSPANLKDIQRSLDTKKPKVTLQGKTIMNPLEVRETGLSLPITFKIGTEAKPFFVSPKTLADKLDKSGAGKDFFKLRTTEKDYLTDLETAIKTEGYKPNPIQIQIQPTGNATVYEGNHRLYRALTKGDKEVPVTFMYTAGAERLNVPFGIKQLESFVAKGEKGYKTEKEYLKYIDEVNKFYKK